MTLKNALNNFERLLSETTKRSEIKVYEEFSRIISKLQERDLSNTEILMIETELDRLDLNASTNNKRHYQKALKQFENFLKTNFSLTTKGYYTKIGLALGMTLGLLFGTVFFSSLERSMGVSLGMALGMFAGLLIGRYMDTQALESGKMV